MMQHRCHHSKVQKPVAVLQVLFSACVFFFFWARRRVEGEGKSSRPPLSSPCAPTRRLQRTDPTFVSVLSQKKKKTTQTYVGPSRMRALVFFPIVGCRRTHRAVFVFRVRVLLVFRVLHVVFQFGVHQDGLEFRDAVVGHFLLFN